MRTERVLLRIGQADGRTASVPMRHNLSHQRGSRCYFGALAEPDAEIGEATEPSFTGANLFEALAVWRATIEPEGWRLLHGAARADCWSRPGHASPFVEQLLPGREATHRLNALDPAPFDTVTTLAEQRANFEAWQAALPPVPVGRVPPREGHGDDPPVVEFGPLARLAGRILGSRE
ncbi:MAG: hypothetical protein JO276_05240 [Sphingomonadaceae bacterium]|nr:hypothetical protein [Sphingomonadaceae bacterium]